MLCSFRRNIFLDEGDAYKDENFFKLAEFLVPFNAPNIGLDDMIQALKYERRTA